MLEPQCRVTMLQRQACCRRHLRSQPEARPTVSAMQRNHIGDLAFCRCAKIATQKAADKARKAAATTAMLGSLSLLSARSSHWPQPLSVAASMTKTKTWLRPAVPTAEDMMFQQEADWKNATKLICDVLRGSGSLAVECHSSTIEKGERQTHFSSWSYTQTQPHRAARLCEPRLFSLEHLEAILSHMSNGDVFAYEVSDAQSLGPEPKEAFAKFSAISLSLVRLVVGEVAPSWILVSLANPRDLILWKMQYHLRDIRL